MPDIYGTEGAAKAMATLFALIDSINSSRTTGWWCPSGPIKLARRLCFDIGRCPDLAFIHDLDLAGNQEWTAAIGDAGHLFPLFKSLSA